MIEDGAAIMREQKYGSDEYVNKNTRTSARLNLEGPNPLNKSHELGVFDSCMTRKTGTAYGTRTHNKVCSSDKYSEIPRQTVKVQLSLGYVPQKMRIDGIGDKSDAFGIRHQRKDIRREDEYGSLENQSIFDSYQPSGTRLSPYSSGISAGEEPGEVKEVLFSTPPYPNRELNPDETPPLAATFDVFGRDAVTLENIGHNQKDVPVYYNNWENIVGERTSLRSIHLYPPGEEPKPLESDGQTNDLTEYKFLLAEPSKYDANIYSRGGGLTHPGYDSYSWEWTARTENKWGNTDKNTVTQDMCKEYEAVVQSGTYPESIVCQISPDSEVNPKEQIINSSKVSREDLIKDVRRMDGYINHVKNRNQQRLDGPDIADEFSIMLLNSRDYEANRGMYQRSYLTWHSGYVWLSPRESQAFPNPG
jgi:hypothetical protein